MHRRAIITLAPLLTLALTALHAQTPAPVDAPVAPAPTTVFKAHTRIVLLDVVVVDKKGKPVGNLKKEDFTVYEDKQPQTILTFEPPSAHIMPPAPDGKPVVNSAADLPKIGNAPVTIMVLDELNTAFSDMAYARQSLIKFLNAQPAVLNQPTALLVADNTRFHLLHDYTQSRAELLAAINSHFPQYPWKMMNSGGSGPGAVERIAQTLGSLLQIAEATRGTPGRKNIIWVGVNAPGVDLINADPLTAQVMTDIVKRVTQTLLETRVTVFYIDPTINKTSTVGLLVPGDDSDSDTFVDTDPFSTDISLDNFAPATGGRIYMSRNDVNNEIANSIDNGNTYYTLSYTPTNKNEDPSKYRNIKIVLSNPDLIAMTRLGYYAEPENANNSVNDKTLDQKQRLSILQLELNQAAFSLLSYNGLPVTAKKGSGPDKHVWLLTVPTNALSWTQLTDGSLRAEVTAMAAVFDESANLRANQHSRYKTTAKTKLVAHTADEMTYVRKPGESEPATVTFRLQPQVPAMATRMRFVVRDAVTGKTGTADAHP